VSENLSFDKSTAGEFWISLIQSENMADYTGFPNFRLKFKKKNSVSFPRLSENTLNISDTTTMALGNF